MSRRALRLRSVIRHTVAWAAVVGLFAAVAWCGGIEVAS